jgi:hypothetical protein
MNQQTLPKGLVDIVGEKVMPLLQRHEKASDNDRIHERPRSSSKRVEKSVTSTDGVRETTMFH